MEKATGIHSLECAENRVIGRCHFGEIYHCQETNLIVF